MPSVPVRVSTAGSMKFSFGGSGYSEPSARNRRNGGGSLLSWFGARPSWRCKVSSRCSLMLRFTIHAAGLVHRGQQRAVCGGESADAQLRASHDAVNGARDIGVAKVQLRGLDRRLAGGHRGDVGLVLGGRGVQFLLADRIDLRQRLGTAQVTLRLLQRGLVLRQRGARLGERLDVGLRVDHEQQFARLHALALARNLLLEDAPHPRADFHGVDRLGLRDVVLGEGCWCMRHGHDADLRRRWRRGLLGRAGEQYRGGRRPPGLPATDHTRGCLSAALRSVLFFLSQFRYGRIAARWPRHLRPARDTTDPRFPCPARNPQLGARS